ncbi:hypothetical protein PPRY_a4314 [Pseudoalteromonas prydzensis ACAM 620]|nr:hypothetical protein [Pseudoalteromonas prydzensis ACAM 620]
MNYINFYAYEIGFLALINLIFYLVKCFTKNYNVYFICIEFKGKIYFYNK